jgi:hypothetical protein
MDRSEFLDDIRSYLGDFVPSLETLRSYIQANEQDVILVLCVATLLVFVLSLRALTRGRRLSRQLQELQLSTQRLITAEETRLLRELRGAPKNGDQRIADPILRLSRFEDSPGGGDVRVLACAKGDYRQGHSGDRA